MMVFQDLIQRLLFPRDANQNRYARATRFLGSRLDLELFMLSQSHTATAKTKFEQNGKKAMGDMMQQVPRPVEL